MRRLWLLTCLAGAVGCNCGTPERALRVVITIDPAQRANCVVLEVSDATAIQISQDIVVRTGRNTLVAGLKQGTLPLDVSLKARAFISADGCKAPRTFNGESVAVSATFPSKDVQTVDLQLLAPNATADVDRDGYVGTALGGSDCNDGDAAIHPGAAQVCLSAIDQDCDGKGGCSDTECSATAACQRTADRLGFTTNPMTVAAGACSAVLTVEVQDATGPLAATAALQVDLTAAPATGVTFYSDATCVTPATGVPLAQGQMQAGFYFRSTTAGTFTATATASGLTPATQLQTVTAPTATQLAFSTPPRSVIANGCSQALTVELRDASNAVTQLSTTATVTVTGNPATGLQLFSDPGCATLLPAGAFDILAGASAGTFYAKGSMAGAVQLTAASASLTSAMQTLTVDPAAATRVRFATSAQGVAVSACSGAVRLESQDATGNPSPVAAATVVALTAAPSAGFTFYSDSGCATAITQVTIAATTSSATIYFRGTATGTVTMTAMPTVLTGDTQQAVIGAGPPAKLTLTTAAQNNVVAGACSGIVTVQSRDAANNPSNISGSALAVVLVATPAVPLQFFSDPACATVITGASIPVGGTTASFYFRSTLAGVVQLAVSSTLPTGDNQNQTIRAANPTVIRFTNPLFAPIADACAGPLAIESADAFGNASNVGALTAVTLSSAPAGVTFFAAAGCGGGGTTTVNIPNAASSVTFYARAQVAANYTLTAAATGLGMATQAFNVTPAAVSKLVAQPLVQTVTAGACNTLSIQRQDPFNNPVTTGGALAVTLLSNATTGLTFHTAATCTLGSIVTGVSIAAATSSVTLYVRVTRVEAVTITGSGGGLTPATHGLTINPDSASQIVFLNNPVSVPTNTCSSALQVQQQDQFGNPVPAASATPVTLTDDGTGFDFHLVANCGDAAATAATMNMGSSTAIFAVQGTTAGSVLVTAAITGLPNGTQTVTVTPSSSATKLVFTTTARSISAGGCSQVITVQRQDVASAAVTTGGPLAVNLSSNATTNATGGLTFHTDGACGTLPVTSASIPGGQSSVDFYVKANVAEMVTLTAAGGSLTNGTQAFTTTVGPASKLTFTSPAPQTLPALGCSALTTVTLRDLGGNAVNTVAARVITFSATPAGPNVTFWTNAACTTAMPGDTRTMAAATSTVQLFFKADNAGNPVLAADTPGITQGTQAETITPALPTQLDFGTLPLTIEAGFCQALPLERRDSLNRPTNPNFATPVTGLTVSAPAAGGLTTQLFSDNACAMPLGFPFDILPMASSTVVYVKGRSGDVAGAATTSHAYLLTASAAGLTNGTLTITVLPLVRRGTCNLAVTTITCPVVPNLTSIDRTILFYQGAAAGDDTPGTDTVTCRLQLNGGTGLAEVVCDRFADGATLGIDWQTASFAYDAANGGVTVQHNRTSMGNGNSSFQNIAVTSSTLSSSFVLSAFMGDGTGTYDGNENFTTQMTSDTQVRISIAANGTFLSNGGPLQFFVTQVVNWSGASVARGITAVGNAMTLPVAVATPNLTRSFLLHSTRMADVTESGNDICTRRMSGVITDATALSFQRGCASDDIGDVSWERVELPANATVQRLTATMANGVANTGNLAITTVDRTRAFVFVGGQGSGGSANGRTTYNAADRLGAAQANATFTAANTIRLDRDPNANDGDAAWGVFVVEVTP